MIAPLLLSLACNSPDADSGVGPVETGPPSTWLDVAPGASHACGVRSDGRLECWGEGAGSPDAVLERVPEGLTALDVSLEIDGATSPSYDQSACARLPDGSATCWGIWPGDLPGPVSALAIGYFHALWLDDGGRVQCFDLAPGEACPDFTPLEGVASFVASSWHVLAVGLDGELQFGLHDTYTTLAPSLPPGPWSQVSLVGADDWICGIRDDGQLDCWGELGDGYGLANPPAGSFTDLCMSWRGGACALDDKGDVACWGDADRFTPAAGPFTRLRCGYDTWCGVAANGEAACWGDCEGGVCDLPG